MTLVISVIGPESVWTVADRRLTIGDRVSSDHACKVMCLETSDAIALLAYAGLGSTAIGNEPAKWMSACLRGRNWPLVPSLEALATAMKREFPPHVSKLASTPKAHQVMIAALVEGATRLYAITLDVSPDGKSSDCQLRQLFKRPRSDHVVTPRICLAGSGLTVLMKERGWRRELLRMVRAHDEGRISAFTVADTFAALNARVARTLPDGTVGERSVVVWRSSRMGVHRGGGRHICYDGTVRANDPITLPCISRGDDMSAIFSALLPEMTRSLTDIPEGETREIDPAAMNAALARLPDTPDERLR